MNMKTFLSVFSLVLVSTTVFARIHEYWPYDRLAKEAEVIVISTPVSVRDTSERTTLPNIVSIGTNNVRSSIPAIGVETTFTNLAVLRGDTNLTTVVFHHLREMESKPSFNGPHLVAFDPKEQKRFLLFLKRESDGRYAPLTGQTDPDGGVRDLGTYP